MTAAPTDLMPPTDLATLGRAVAASTRADRARWLRAVADDLDAARDELVGIADEETALGAARLVGEVARTSGQLRTFAGVLDEGSYLEVVIDHADPAATPPRPDLRRLLVPLGPVAVFAASNFPFAFSVLGGDTASALAAGCPVVVKAHPGHPRLSRRVAEFARAALDAAGAPEGTLSLVEGVEEGVELVRHPAIRAVGFTGSTRGGRALLDVAAARPEPIPFYGELGSLNPVVVTPAALAARADELAAGLAGSFTLGGGQFCTKPGVVLVPAGSGFAERVAAHATAALPERLLTPSIADAFDTGIAAFRARPGARVLDAGTGASVVEVAAADVLADPEGYLEECFGPVTLVVECDPGETEAVLAAIGGTLTATLHREPGEDVADWLTLLAERAGRVLLGGWPTGVAVAWAQHHGGPWPATTSPHTSVGATAIRRFLRPLAFQNAAPEELPVELRDEAVGIPRRIDGVLQLG